MAGADLKPDSDRVKAAWAAVLWLAVLGFFLRVLVTDTELTTFRGSLSESASDVLALPLALFSAWAFCVWLHRLVRAYRA
jgi:hypothetical protein